MKGEPNLFTQQARNKALKSIYAYIARSIEKDRVKIIKLVNKYPYET